MSDSDSESSDFDSDVSSGDFTEDSGIGSIPSTARSSVYTDYGPPKEYGEKKLTLEDLASDVFEDFCDEDGFAPVSDLGEIVHMLGIRVSEEELDDAKLVLDMDSSGRMAQNEFVHWWIGIHDRAQEQRKQQGDWGDDDEAPQARLLDVRRDRKMLERDAELLRNRIQLLQKEEMRTLKRITAANKKASGMYIRRKNSEMKHIQKRKLRRERLKAIKTCQEQNYVRKELARIAKMRAANDVVTRKIKQANDIKNIRRDLESQKRSIERENLARARQHHELVVARRLKHKQAKKKREGERQKQSSLKYLNRVVKERKLQRNKTEQLQQLESDEARLMQRVQNAHLMQTEALGSLGDILCT